MSTISWVKALSMRLLSWLANIRKIDKGLLVLAALPWLLLLTNRSWIFTPAGYVDPWIYFGYFHNLDQYLKVFTRTYFATRLPWILPGYLSYKLFPPLVANYVLHLGFYYIAVFSLYFILKQMVSSRAALVTSILMGGYPFFLGAIGWDYVDGAGITYFLLTMLFLTLAAKTLPRQKWQLSLQRDESRVMTLSLGTATMLFLAGASAAAMMLTNMFLVFLTPALIIYYLLTNRNGQRNPLIISLLFLLLGFVALAVLLGSINVVAGGHSLLFSPNLYYGLNLLIQPNPWKAPDCSWLSRATWLVLPSLVFLTSIISLAWSARHRPREREAPRPNSTVYLPVFIFSLTYIVTALIMALMELAGSPALQLYYYASYLIPGMALAAGAQISPLLNRLDTKRFIWLIAGLIVLLIIPLQPAFHRLVVSHLNLSGILYPLIAAALLTICLALTNRRAIGVVARSAAILLFALTSFTLASSAPDIDYSDSQREQTLLAVHQSIAEYRPFNSSGDLRFWYSSDEPLGNVYRAVASTDLWIYRLVNESFPALDDMLHPGEGIKVKIPEGTKIVILSSQENVVDRADASLESLGLRARLLGQKRIMQGTIDFVMTFIQAEPR